MEQEARAFTNCATEIIPELVYEIISALIERQLNKIAITELNPHKVIKSFRKTPPKFH